MSGNIQNLRQKVKELKLQVNRRQQDSNQDSSEICIIISLIAEPAENEDFMKLIQRTGWIYKDKLKQAKIFE